MSLQKAESNLLANEKGPQQGDPGWLYIYIYRFIWAAIKNSKSSPFAVLGEH